MALLSILAAKARRGEPVFTAEISPPRLYLEIDRIVGIARQLRALGLDAIAVTNSTGGSYKFSPWAIVEDIQRAMGHVPLIIHLTARDEGSARSVYYHLHEMSLKGVRDVLIIRGDPSPGNSKLLDSYRFTTSELINMAAGYRRGSLIDGSHCEPLPNLDIFVAAHPEFPDKALDKHFGFLKRKIDAGADGLIANIVTDADAFFRYRDRAHDAGIRQPIIPSVLPLNSVRRCEFLAEQLHIAVPAATVERLRGADRDSAQRFGLDDLIGKLRRLIAGGAPGANFNIVVPSDAEVVVNALKEVRAAATQQYSAQPRTRACLRHTEDSMAHGWLLKTEPSTYSFADLQRDKRTVWDGVKNPQALKNISQVKKGDRLLIYHTGDEKAVVGSATALSDGYPDPKKHDPKLLVLDLAPAAALPRPVPLAEIKANAKFTGWELVRLPRLSVMPVSKDHWAEIERLAKRS
jgi:5,10-methylenetetrahydrofolate reductase/predicted RNA-binding protein with PUA-like domain